MQKTLWTLSVSVCMYVGLKLATDRQKNKERAFKIHFSI